MKYTIYVLRVTALLLCSVPIQHCRAQKDSNNVRIDTAINLSSLPDRTLRLIDKKQASLTASIDRQTQKLLQDMAKREAKLQRKMQGIDSIKAQQVFAGAQAKYQQLQQKLQSPVKNSSVYELKEYLPGIDSLQSSMQFLQKLKPGLPADKLAQINGIAGKVEQLQGKMQAANELQTFIKERDQQLKDQLSKYGLGKQLLGINKQVYYYQEQMRKYKELINNPDKMVQVVLSKLCDLPAFKSFWQRNSIIGQLFPMPDNTGGSTVVAAGLQTRDQVATMINQRVPGAMNANGDGGSNYLQQQLQTAQSQMSALKDKINQFGGGSSDMAMPDFKPNNQKYKPFLKRLEYGFNIQNNQSTSFLPTISDIGLTLGYKLSDKAVMGIGTSYKLGLGRGLNHIALSSQGISMRSYMDIKAKGSIWLTGGYEYNYMQQFSKLRDLRTNVDVWQRSALIGITKKYKIGKNKQGNMQLLYDLLHKHETPRGTALKFRVGYNF